MKYKIDGGSLPVVTCYLEENEQMLTERGSMAWMSPNLEMTTTSNGGVGRAIGRLFAGESMFQNIYTAKGAPGMIAFASSFPGCIRAVEIAPGREMIVQKGAFLACERGVNVSVHLQRKFKTGFFGGEGFVMQKLTGNGVAFIEIDGHATEYNLEAGQKLVVDTGYLTAMDASCSVEVVTVSGVKNMFLGGEGFFHTVVSGPGRVILQSMPLYAVARSIQPYIITTSK